MKSIYVIVVVAVLVTIVLNGCSVNESIVVNYKNISREETVNMPYLKYTNPKVSRCDYSNVGSDSLMLVPDSDSLSNQIAYANYLFSEILYDGDLNNLDNSSSVYSFDSFLKYIVNYHKDDQQVFGVYLGDVNLTEGVVSSIYMDVSSSILYSSKTTYLVNYVDDNVVSIAEIGDLTDIEDISVDRIFKCCPESNTILTVCRRSDFIDDIINDRQGYKHRYSKGRISVLSNGYIYIKERRLSRFRYHLMKRKLNKR
ncbi:MAG: hypothetical protein MJZ13_01105 [Bacteroidales bacterium]|nr:hypothetical protein [Bacteroidales bacterium]